MKKVLVYLLFLLSGCSTTVDTIKKDIDKIEPSNKDDKGYLLLGLNSNRNLKSLYIDGPKDIEVTQKDLQIYDDYIFLDLPEGEYRISKIRFSRYVRSDIDEESYWSFSVKANEINYVGDLNIKSFFFSSNYTIELINNSSLALEFLEQSYPTILSKRAITFGGPGKDLFLDKWSKKEL